MKKTLKTGPGFDDGVNQGPLITEKAIAKVLDNFYDMKIDNIMIN